MYVLLIYKKNNVNLSIKKAEHTFVVPSRSNLFCVCVNIPIDIDLYRQ